MSVKSSIALRRVIIAQVFVSILVILILISDFLEGASRINTDIGTPIVVLLLLAQLTVGIVALMRSRRLN